VSVNHFGLSSKVMQKVNNDTAADRVADNVHQLCDGLDFCIQSDDTKAD